MVFTYVRRDFIDGENFYGARSLYRPFREKHQVWLFGLHPDDVSALVAVYGWRVIGQAGPDYFVEHYIRPTRRNLGASQLEWSCYADKS